MVIGGGGGGSQISQIPCLTDSQTHTVLLSLFSFCPYFLCHRFSIIYFGCNCLELSNLFYFPSNRVTSLCFDTQTNKSCCISCKCQWTTPNTHTRTHSVSCQLSSGLKKSYLCPDGEDKDTDKELYRRKVCLTVLLLRFYSSSAVHVFVDHGGRKCPHYKVEELLVAGVIRCNPPHVIAPLRHRHSKMCVTKCWQNKGPSKKTNPKYPSRQRRPVKGAVLSNNPNLLWPGKHFTATNVMLLKCEVGDANQTRRIH